MALALLALLSGCAWVEQGRHGQATETPANTATDTATPESIIRSEIMAYSDRFASMYVMGLRAVEAEH